MKKVALVTGSRRGIGKGIVKALGTQQDYLCIVSDIIAREEAQDVLDELKALNIEADYIKCDISNTEDRKAVFAQIVEKYGRIDLLVNNAGVAPRVRLDILETTEESFDFLININMRGTFFMCQECANTMIALKNEGKIENYQPRIVNIASMSSYTSSTNRGEYCISKAGISMVTLLFADKLAEYGIPVFEVRPGIIMTDMTATVTEKYTKLINEGVTPIKRFGQPEDVANCVLAAASGLLDFSTGQVLNADGGFHIRRL
ncbi:MAG: 3-ketoacyl-ACP reductase [Clostridia bacterium]|nr:3-ketoacyl-ACP reductase [Clostridia bacterium]